MSDIKSEVRATNRNALRGHAIVGIVSGLVAGLTTLSVHSMLSVPPPRVATVDVSSLLSGEAERLQETGMDSAKAEAYAQIWGPLLDQSIQDIADEYDVVLLASPAVAAGAPDMTALLRERLDSEVAKFK